MPQRRRELVQQAFAKLDPDGVGEVELDVVARMYSTRHHPDVKAGRRSERDVLDEFLDTFGIRDGLRRTVSVEDFTEYYEKISAACEDDNYFQLMMWNSWFDDRGRTKGVRDDLPPRLLQAGAKPRATMAPMASSPSDVLAAVRRKLARGGVPALLAWRRTLREVDGEGRGALDRCAGACVRAAP